MHKPSPIINSESSKMRLRQEDSPTEHREFLYSKIMSHHIFNVLHLSNFTLEVQHESILQHITHLEPKLLNGLALVSVTCTRLISSDHNEVFKLAKLGWPKLENLLIPGPIYSSDGVSDSTRDATRIDMLFQQAPNGYYNN